MSGKAGKPYEKLTQAIFQAIHGQKEFPNLVVKHDVTLQGKIRPHQIDVYWKFVFRGVPHEVIVQSKDWRKPVDQGQLIQFKGVLDDLPGQPKGIFVTRTGYQEGAKEFALAHGILLYELKEADDLPPLQITMGGWAHLRVIGMPSNGLVLTSGESKSDAGSAVAFGFDYDVFTPYYSGIKFTPLKDWLQGEYPTEDIDSITKLTFPAVPPNERLFFDATGVVVGNLASVLRETVEGMKNDKVEKKEVTHTFEPAVFIQTGSSRFPRVKVTAVSVSVEIKQTHVLRRAKMSNLTQLVLHQLNSDEKWWFAATPKVISSLSKRTSKKRRN